MASPNSSPALECLLSPQASWQQTFFFQHFLRGRLEDSLVINFILMNYMLNPFAPCAVLCSFVHSAEYKRTFLSESLNFSWKKKKKNPYFESWNLTHSCQQLLGVWRNVPPSFRRAGIAVFPSPCLHPRKRPPPARHPAASVPEKRALWFHFRVLLYHFFNWLITLPLFRLPLS